MKGKKKKKKNENKRLRNGGSTFNDGLAFERFETEIKFFGRR